MRLLLLRALRRSYSAAAETASKAAQEGKNLNITSIAPAGQVLKGLNVKKGGEDPVALSEEEYPAWLWEVLDEKAQKKKVDENPERKAAKERREANRQKIKSSNFIASMNK